LTARVAPLSNIIQNRRDTEPIVINIPCRLGCRAGEILRNSGLHQAGYDFFFDPLIMVFGTVDGLGSKGEIQMSAGVHNTEMDYLMTDLNFPTFVYLAQSMSKMRLHKTFSRSSTLMIMVKIKDSLGGRITGGGGVRKSLNESDKAKLKHGLRRKS
jgi:hypothetical protein